MADKDNEKPKSNAIFIEGRGGGQGKPRTPSGNRKPWQPPKNPTTAANRERPANALSTALPTRAPESWMFGLWELSVVPVHDGSRWVWTATIPDREDENGKQFTGASFRGQALTKEDAKCEARYTAEHTLLG